ncbi:MAG TPA: transglycosylase domain-containing protein [Pseudolysinimonas sp.]|jgi:membrane peptidoglycan carboxypeptidase
MPAQKKTASSLFAAVLGTLGFSALAGLLVTVMIAPALAVTGMTANNTIGIFESLPEYMTIDNQHQQNEILAKNADGSDFHIATVYDQNREEVSLDEMSDNLKNAAIAGEDRRYYDHGGIDVPSVVRAAVGQAAGTSSSGASTITMQLVRNIRVQEAFNEPGVDDKQRAKDIAAATYPDLGRKLQEMKYAIGLEKVYSKQTILAAYLNIVGMGQNTYGVQAAAQEYFGTTADKVTIAQAASLIAIVQNPTKNGLFSPKNYAANQKRRDVILGFMYTEHYITDAQYKEALATKVDAKFVHVSAPTQGCLNAAAGYQFVCDDAVNRILNGNIAGLGSSKAEQVANWKAGGYKVYVSIVPALQDAANSIVKKYAPPSYTTFALGATAVTTQVGTGKILDMAQNKNYNNLPNNPDPTVTSVNFADDKVYGGSVGFQPGSTYKPYTLLNFLKSGHGLNETFDAGILQLNQASFADTCPDANGGWGGIYKYRNDEGEHGPYTVMRGTAGSVNSVFLQMGTKVDQCDTKAIAVSLGVHNAYGAQDGSDLRTDPSCVIGGCDNTIAPLTQAAAFAGIADGGYYCHPTLIDSLVDPQGNTIAGENANCGQSAEVSPDVAGAAAYAMAGVVNGGTAAASNPHDGTAYIGKTGTTDNSVHTWMVGSSHQTSTAVWVGNISGKQALRSVRVNGIQAAVLRHSIFKPLAQAIDAYGSFGGGAGFPAPGAQFLTGSPATVPTGLIGGTVEAAQSAITLAELTYADGGPIDSDLPVGAVASLNPGEGATVPRGTTVTVYTSNGSAKEVPNEVGQDPASATSDLHSKGFMNVSETCVAGGPTDPDNGKVVSQVPAAGAVVNPTTAVTLTYKKFPGAC